MTSSKHDRSSVYVIDESEPLATLITIRNGREVVVSADRDSESDETARHATTVFGAWADLDWDEAAAALDEIRHESDPTPPVDE